MPHVRGESPQVHRDQLVAGEHRGLEAIVSVERAIHKRDLASLDDRLQMAPDNLADTASHRVAPNQRVLELEADE